MREIFNEYDADNDKRLTKSEFLEYFQVKSRTNYSTVMKNLESHGFGKDLRLHSDQDCKYDEEQYMTKDLNELPRAVMSMNDEIFQFLFNLEGQIDD